MAHEKTHLEKAAQGVLWCQQSMFAGLFCFMCSVPGKALLMENPLIKHQLPLQVVFFPLSAFLELVELALAMVMFYKQKIKNTDRILQLAVTAIKTSTIVVGISIAGSGAVASVKSAAVFPPVVPFLFVAAHGLNTLNHVIRAMYHYHQMMDEEVDAKIRIAHADAFKKHLLGAIIGSVLTGAIAALFVCNLSTAWGLGLCSGIGLAAVLVSVILPLVWSKIVSTSDGVDMAVLVKEEHDLALGKGLHGNAVHDKGAKPGVTGGPKFFQSWGAAGGAKCGSKQGIQMQPFKV